MFMFRNKRNHLNKKLIEIYREKSCEFQTEHSSDEILLSLKALLKRFKLNQLQMLLNIIENRGRYDVAAAAAALTDDDNNGNNNNCCCVLLSRENEPHLLCCQVWRWPDLGQSDQLRRLPICRTSSDTVYICCNPYHWSRLCQPNYEYPPPPYSVCAMDTLKPEDRAPSEAPLVFRNSTTTTLGSLTTSGECDSSMNSSSWCKLAYWEMGKRVGPLYPVEQPAVNVFGQVPYGDGLSLETLARHNFSPPESVARTRDKIGLGITISNEEDSVWVYNRSKSPIFVNSFNLNYEEMSTPIRVPGDYCLCIFDRMKTSQLRNNNELIYKKLKRNLGPIDRNSIRISFVKGWGPRYSRQEITSCPCWLEILLSPCR